MNILLKKRKTELCNITLFMVLNTSKMAAVVTFSAVRPIAPFRNMDGIGELSPILIFPSSSIIRTLYNIHPIVPFSHVTVAYLNLYC